MNEPITFVVERRPDGREFASIVRGRLTGRIAEKGNPLLVYALRIDRLADSEQQFWLSKGCAELVDVYHWLKAEGTLPT